jgi:peptidoglycan pentaglycine glycine transferase (the first glycine)
MLLPDVRRIYAAVAARAGFALHADAYYQRAFAAFGPHTRLYGALVAGRPEAFLWVVEGGGVAFELYGGATERGAAHKANYALKWWAIAQARRDGDALYDLNGRLSTGIDQFKGGFGGEETDYVGTYDLPVRREGYAAWRAVWPLAKPLGRVLLRRVRRPRSDYA